METVGELHRISYCCFFVVIMVATVQIHYSDTIYDTKLKKNNGSLVYCISVYKCVLVY